MVDRGKILIEGMDLSGKSTIIKCLSEMLNVKDVKKRTLCENCELYDFTVAQSKKGNLSQDVINQLYVLSIRVDMDNYKPKKEGIVLQDSYSALRTYALAQKQYPERIKELDKLLKGFPKPEFAFYLTASTEERLRRNAKRDKPMAYMEKLLVSNPKEFEEIEKNLREITTKLFGAEVIDTQDISPEGVAMYIINRVQEQKLSNRENGGKEEVYERK